MKEVEHDNQWLQDVQRNAREGQWDEPVEQEAPVDDNDPFSPSNAPALQLITLMRIYDVGLALLRESNPEVAQKLAELHAQGKILGSLPLLDLDEEA